MTAVALKAADKFCNHPLWGEAMWVATTFRCHPTGEVPPVLGVVFADADKGLKLFQSWTNDWSHFDQQGAIRIAVIEGDPASKQPEYAIRISANGKEAGQIQRMYPSPESDMYQQFKVQYLQHGEFMICPTAQRDQQLWFNADAGIVKNQIIFRNIGDVSENDQDSPVLKETPIEKALNEFNSKRGSDLAS